MTATFLPPSFHPSTFPRPAAGAAPHFLGGFAEETGLVQAQVWAGGRVWDGDAADGAGAASEEGVWGFHEDLGGAEQAERGWEVVPHG